MAPSYYLNPCWILISEVQLDLPESDFTVRVKAAILYDDFEDYTIKITATSPKTVFDFSSSPIANAM